MPDARPSPRFVATIGAALAAGALLGYVDSRPTFDDTGAIAFAVMAVAALFAALDGRFPWLWALLVGLPIPLVEAPLTGSTASALALVFAALGAGVGWILGRAARVTTLSGGS